MEKVLSILILTLSITTSTQAANIAEVTVEDDKKHRALQAFEKQFTKLNNDYESLVNPTEKQRLLYQKEYNRIITAKNSLMKQLKIPMLPGALK